MSFPPVPGAYTRGMRLLATTGPSGFSLVNGTPSILSYTMPNDGNLHRVFAIMDYLVTSNATGGQVNLQFDDPAGNFQSRELVAGGGTAGFQTVFAPSYYITQPGQPVFLAQSSALTGGAATVWAELWGS